MAKGVNWKQHKRAVGLLAALAAVSAAVWAAITFIGPVVILLPVGVWIYVTAYWWAGQ